MNKYNIRAIRKDIDDHVRNRAWKRLQTRLSSLLATSNNYSDLFEAVVLQKSSKVANGGSLLHAIVKQRHESILSLATTIARAVPQALMVQDAQMQTPLHIAIGKSQPPEMMEVFLDVLCDWEVNEEGGSSSFSSTQLSVVNVLSIQDQAGDTPLLKAARENETKFIPILLRYDKSFGTLLIQQKRKKRTALSYMASNELHNAYKYDQYVLPTELKMVLIGTYFALMHENQEELSETEVQFWEELLNRSASTTTNTYNIKTGMAKINEDNDGVRLVARALVGCSHLLGKYAIKLMDFLLENDIYRDCFLSQELDQHGNFMVHCICGKSINNSGGNVTTNVLLLEQLQQKRTKFATATRHANREGNMPLHLAVTTCQMDLVHPLVETCPMALEHVNRRGELPLHIAMKLPESSIVKHSATRFSQSIVKCLWTARPGSLEVRDGPTLLYPFQLAACSEWGPRLQEHRHNSDDDVVMITGHDKTTDTSCQTSSKYGDAKWVDVIYTLLLAAPQAVL